MNSRRAGETTIKTSIRIRPCSQQEKEAFPGPSPVQAAPGEVRVYHKQFLPGSGRNSPSNLSRSRPATPSSPHVTPRGASSPSLVWRQQAAAQLSNEYQSYPFANVFGPEEGNEDVYKGSGCRDVVGAVLGGCNGTIFVYGQTGAGKTHTMDAVTDLVLQQLYAAADDSSNEVSITVSAVELYNEVLRCLLTGRENLQLRWASGAGSFAGVVLEGAEERSCSSIEEAAALVTMAKASRAVGETRANARSSRSHLIVRVKVEVLQLSDLAGGASPSPAPPSPTASSPTRRPPMAPAAAAKEGKPLPASVTFSTLNLVDLAGSERIDKSGSADTPLRLREALNINKSLLCLGNVVMALAERSEGKRSNHIPYRDSKLTRLLEDSLGGNATTALVACITPLPEWHLEQSRNTLEFAARAARVVCKPQRNVLSLTPAGGPSADAAALIAALQAEVAALKQQLAEQQAQPSQPPQLHALSVVPVSCSTSLWDGGGGAFGGGVGGVLLTSRGSGVLAGVAEHGGEAGEADSECGSPTAASCPTSPSGRHSPTGRRGWTTRLRMSLTGGSLFASHDGTLGLSSADSSKGVKGSALLHSPSRIPSPKHSLFSALASPRFAGKASAIPSGPVGGEQQAVASQAPVAAIQTHPAAPPSDAGSSSSPGALPASAHTTSIISRASGTQKSLLWKLLQQPHPHDRNHLGGQPLHHRASNSGGGSSSSSSNRGTHSAASLRSAGLLITSSGNAAAAAAAVAASHAAASGGNIFQRWATFSGGRVSPVSTASLMTAHVDSGAADTHDDGTAAVPSHPLQLATHAFSLHTGRSSLASRRLTADGATWGAAGSVSHAGGGRNTGPDRQVGLLDSVGTHMSSLESRMTAAEAAMALRDHIIKQLVLALQQKKAEIRALKEQLASVLKQLESSEGEEATNKAKLRELAEGIQMLAAARQEEFERWKGHLLGLEAALQAAQSEATNYRDESQSLVHQLAELQAQYNSLQIEQHNSLAVSTSLAQQQQQQQDEQLRQEQEQQQQQQEEERHRQRHEQLAACLSRLAAVESALQDMLRLPSEAVGGSRGATPKPRGGSRPCTPLSMQQQVIPEDAAATATTAPAATATAAEGAPETSAAAAAVAAAGEPVQQHEHVKGECESHSIQTVSTRVFDSGATTRLTTSACQPQPLAPSLANDLANSLTAVAEEAAAAARLSHIEFVLVELQELMPLVKAAVDAALQACQPGTRKAAAAAAAGLGSSCGGVLEGHHMQRASAGGLGGGHAAIHGLSVLGGYVRQPSALQTSSTVDNVEGKQQDQAVHTQETKVSVLAGAGLMTATKCRKCESLKPLLVIMQKLKDEVVLLKAAVRTRDSQLAAVEETAAGLRADLLESRQQVGALRERIDELSEDLELARVAAATAAAAATSTPTAADGTLASNRSSAAGPAAPATGDGSDRQQWEQEEEQRPRSPGCELSERELAPVRQVPLMADNTPLEALHAQILQSWQALSMPFAYRCAFVLGPNSSTAASAGSTSSSGSSGGSAADADAGRPSASAAADAVTGTPATAAAAPLAAAAAAAASQGVWTAPWVDRGQCQAHVALLACLHQYNEDEPSAAEQQREVLLHEARVVDAGLAALPAGQLAHLLQCWGVSTAAASPHAGSTAAAAAAASLDPAAQRAALLAKLWVPSNAATAAQLAADSAAACQLALEAAPPAELAAVSLRCNASVIAAASNALADAAS